MKWKVEDSIAHWLKVRSDEGRAYFILWDQRSDFLAIDLLAVIPANPAESTQLIVQLKPGDLPGLHQEEIATSVIQDRELMRLWLDERLQLVRRGELRPLRFPRRLRKKKSFAGAA